VSWRFLLRVPVPWVFALFYALGVVLEVILPTPLHDRHVPLWKLAGEILFVVGAAIAGWGLLTFRRARTTTVPGNVSSQLVTWGPYRFTRNPMYVGLTLAYLGESGILQHVWPIVLLPAVLMYVNGTVIPLEESTLQEVFGDTYEHYRKRVRRWI
jgi:protein-S-isoprenylcysteine O-methyltransferase Ste14